MAASGGHWVKGSFQPASGGAGGETPPGEGVSLPASLNSKRVKGKVTRMEINRMLDDRSRGVTVRIKGREPLTFKHFSAGLYGATGENDIPNGTKDQIVEVIMNMVNEATGF